jgi:hypothetical protein
MYVNIDWASLSSWFWVFLNDIFCRLRMAPVWEPLGTPLSQYGVVCVVCIMGVLSGLFKRAPLLASWFAMSLHVMPVCALTF